MYHTFYDDSTVKIVEMFTKPVKNSLNNIFKHLLSCYTLIFLIFICIEIEKNCNITYHKYTKQH